jgi:hypothetical protein
MTISPSILVMSVSSAGPFRSDPAVGGAGRGKGHRPARCFQRLPWSRLAGRQQRWRNQRYLSCAVLSVAHADGRSRSVRRTPSLAVPYRRPFTCRMLLDCCTGEAQIVSSARAVEDLGRESRRPYRRRCALAPDEGREASLVRLGAPSAEIRAPREDVTQGGSRSAGRPVLVGQRSGLDPMRRAELEYTLIKITMEFSVARESS